MEKIADKGNGNYAYIDSILEAKKVLVSEMGGTLFTIAKDVKIQIEFNPAKVRAYRLIGYENRMLKKEDFNNDAKDAGELGSGHSVTALYEIIPADADEKVPVAADLKYQDTRIKDEARETNEILTLKLRYKKPDADTSKLIVNTLTHGASTLQETSNNFRFSAAVAEYGMMLRGSEFKAEASWTQVLALAKGAKGEDPLGYRAEFIRLADTCRLLSAH